jgi:class 3 adenylate cyclase
VSATGISSDLSGKAAGGRKLLAVVYADMVGYSRLIGLDDAGTLRRLRTLRRALIDPAIRDHGGRIVQTGGDSLLVAFAAQSRYSSRSRCMMVTSRRIAASASASPSTLAT